MKFKHKALLSCRGYYGGVSCPHCPLKAVVMNYEKMWVRFSGNIGHHCHISLKTWSWEKDQGHFCNYRSFREASPQPVSVEELNVLKTACEGTLDPSTFLSSLLIIGTETSDSCWVFFFTQQWLTQRTASNCQLSAGCPSSLGPSDIFISLLYSVVDFIFQTKTKFPVRIINVFQILVYMLPKQPLE